MGRLGRCCDERRENHRHYMLYWYDCMFFCGSGDIVNTAQFAIDNLTADYFRYLWYGEGRIKSSVDYKEVKGQI